MPSMPSCTLRVNSYQLIAIRGIIVTNIYVLPHNANIAMVLYNPNIIYLMFYGSIILGWLPGFICLCGIPPLSLALACHLRI